MPDLALQLAGVRKAYEVGTPIETEVLHGVDLVIDQGELVAVIGPSGSGKSTLLNIIGLLDRPTAGRLALLGEDTTSLDEAAITRLRGREIGFVFQYHHLIAAFSALENVMMPMLVARGWPDAAMRARALELLERVGLGAFAANKATNLSGGQQQRVAVARALAASPRLILADEPTGNLDSESASAVFDLLLQVNREYGTTVLIVTHNMALAERCRRTVQVIDGRIVA